MSSQALAWAFEKIVPDLRDAVQKLVLLRLADRADPGGVCWPGHARTGKDLNVSQRSVQRVVEDLQKLGLLKVEDRPGTSSKIFLKLDVVVDEVVAAANKKKPKKKKHNKINGGDAMSPPAQLQRGGAMSPRGRHHVTPGGDTVSPKPLIEPVIEPTTTPTVVVVDELHWPPGLNPHQRDACRAALESVSQDRQQWLIDELAGRLAIGGIKNPPGYLRELARREVAGGLVLELAQEVAAIREARAAAAARMACGPLPPTPASTRPAERSAISAAGLAAAKAQLARLRTYSSVCG